MNATSDHKVTLEWIFGYVEKLRRFESNLIGGTMFVLFTAFVKWLYTDKLSWQADSYDFYDMWRLAEVLGAPRLQNASVEALCNDQPWFTGPDRDVTEEQYCLSHAHILQECWNETKFSDDEIQGSVLGKNRLAIYEIWECVNSEDYWLNKKRLLFLLHLNACNGPNDKTNIEIASKGGDLAVHLSICSFGIEIDDEEKHPRNRENIHKYLVDEALLEYPSAHLPENDPNISDDAPESDAALAIGGASNTHHSNIIQEDEAPPGAPIGPNNTPYIKQENIDDATHLSLTPTPSGSNQSKKRARPTGGSQDEDHFGIGPEILKRRGQFLAHMMFHSEGGL